VVGSAGGIEYTASPLVTAMLRGGVCILDEGNRMSEKSWASLAQLLDNRRYVESIVAGVKIKAHADFRFCATMNDDASTFEIWGSLLHGARLVVYAADNVSPSDLGTAIRHSGQQLSQLLTDVETTEAQVQAKEAAVANAELQLGYTEIRAPIAGRTGQLNLHEGALVKANDASFTLVTINQLAPIAVAYAVPEASLASLRTALAAGVVTVTASPHDGVGKSVEGRLDFIDNAVDPTTGTILLKAVFANADRALWPGQFVDIVTRLGEEPGTVLVPAAAVQSGQHGSQVFVVKPDRTVELRQVETGPTANGLTAIRSGVRADETVVTDGQLRLVPGARVEPKLLVVPGEGVAASPEAGAPKEGS
jgi:RND family efflux transporter MFP subunit